MVLDPISAGAIVAKVAPLVGPAPLARDTLSSNAGAFGKMLVEGVDRANQAQIDADKMVKAFTLDDSIPIHQVTFALEEARFSLELLVQMRNRMLESYQQIMNMQL
jgi:flagellar hook-basal body complex protein FliE